MSITKCSTVLKKGVLCSTSDQMISLDKEHVSSKNKYKQLECGKNTSPLLLADIGSNNSQLNLMDVLRARKTKNLHQTRIRAIQLKNSTQVAKHRPNKSTRGKRGLKITKTKQESLGRSNESAKLIGVFGGANVGKASFMQLLKQNQQIIASDEQANRVILEHSDSKVNLFFETSEMYLEKTTPIQEADACVVMFAVSDKASFQFAKHCIQNIRKSHREDLPIFLVANKSDLIRHRKVSPNDAIRVANFQTCQYFETSLIFNYNVPELLQDILNQVQKNKTKKCMRCLHRVAEAFQNRLKKFFM